MRRLATSADTKTSADQMRCRRKADEQAIANARLEGQVSSPGSDRNFGSFVRCRIEIEDDFERLKAKHGLS
jgi:hypothetical protein